MGGTSEAGRGGETPHTPPALRSAIEMVGRGPGARGLDYVGSPCLTMCHL